MFQYNVCKAFESQLGWEALACLFVPLEECLEALGILPDTQAAKPKQHL